MGVAKKSQPRPNKGDPKRYPLVSIISCFYNRAGYIEKSVNSLLAQTYQNIEIILVDDGSKDDTLSKLSVYTDERINIISHPNKGFVRALRDAIAIANGDIIAIHGSGDISLPTRIEEQVNALIDDPNIGVVGCYVRNFDIIRDKWEVLRPRIDKNQLATVIKHNPFTHGEVMFRRTCYEQVGGYRDFFKFAQDRDLWLRMASITRFFVVPEVLYQRDTIEGSVTKNPAKSREQVYLSEFAVYCAVVRKAKGYDPLDIEGESAFQKISKEHNLRLSARLRAMAHRYLAIGDIFAANGFILESVNLDPTSRKSKYLSVLLSLASKNSIFAAVLKKIFQLRTELA